MKRIFLCISLLMVGNALAMERPIGPKPFGAEMGMAPEEAQEILPQEPISQEQPTTYLQDLPIELRRQLAPYAQIHDAEKLEKAIRIALNGNLEPLQNLLNENINPNLTIHITPGSKQPGDLAQPIWALIKTWNQNYHNNNIEKILSLMIPFGLDLNAKILGLTPLQWLTSYYIKKRTPGITPYGMNSLDMSFMSILGLLLDNGANPNIRDDMGRTTLDILQQSKLAKSTASDKIVALLKIYDAKTGTEIDDITFEKMLSSEGRQGTYLEQLPPELREELYKRRK